LEPETSQLELKLLNLQDAGDEITRSIDVRRQRIGDNHTLDPICEVSCLPRRVPAYRIL